MKQGTLKIKELGKLLEAVSRNAKVYAPQKKADDVELLAWAKGQGVVLDYENLTLSPKALFFPQCEVLCRFSGETFKDAPLPEEPFVAFGIRPCDARALACLDKIFGEFGGRQDPYYCKRRENSVVVSMACAAPCATCFCTSVGGDPADTVGADVTLYVVGKTLLFEALTAKGEAFLDDHKKLLSKVTEADEKARDALVKKARESMTKMDLAELKQKLESSFESKEWDSISEVCRGCGLCTYVCPTCHCFDITDEIKGDEGRRVRSWDSCQFSQFTLHASGHNPRTEKTQRMRQRILHKFLYTVDNVGEIFCVGCGRCVKKCPVNLDIREALQRLNELGEE